MLKDSGRCSFFTDNVGNTTFACLRVPPGELPAVCRTFVGVPFLCSPLHSAFKISSYFVKIQAFSDRSFRLLCPRLTSYPPPAEGPTFIGEIRYPRVMRYTFTLMPATSTTMLSVSVRDFAGQCLLIQHVRLICSSCSSGQCFASGFLQTIPHGGRPCRWLTVPLTGSVKDL